MTYQSDPPRLRVSGSPDDPLVQALEEARLELPSEEQLAAVAGRLSLGSGASRGAPVSIARARLRAKSMQAAAVALAVAMGAAATVMMRGHFPFSSAPRVEPQTLPAPPATIPREKPTPRPRHVEQNVTPPVQGPNDSPPPEQSKPQNNGPSSSAHREHSSPREAERPSQADLPSSDTDGPPTTEAEAALLGRAHQSLASDPARALALTEEHRREYPAGLLGQESDLIAIEALAAMGRTGDARDRAARFRARYPSSAHLRRIDRLLGDPGGATTPAP